MAYETILFDVADGAAKLTLNRPDRLNSFTLHMHGEVADAISKIENDPNVRVLLITGAGRGFLRRTGSFRSRNQAGWRSRRYAGDKLQPARPQHHGHGKARRCAQ
ncbi:MAG: enoyl-CoA hydratase-related protein [Rhizomicrobium sp.]